MRGAELPSLCWGLHRNATATPPSTIQTADVIGAGHPTPGNDHHIEVHSRQHVRHKGKQDDEAVTIFLFLVTFMLGAQAR